MDAIGPIIFFLVVALIIAGFGGFLWLGWWMGRNSVDLPAGSPIIRLKPDNSKVIFEDPYSDAWHGPAEERKSTVKE